MDTTVWLLAIFTYLWNYVESVTPEVCFANFRWDDCGYPPQAVLYYYKPGSRCEVGFWRGCYPNPNMFKDEYECVNTCIFTVRAQPADYHNLNDLEPDGHEIEIPGDNITDILSTTPAGETEGNSTATDSTGAAEDATQAVKGNENPNAANGTSVDGGAAGGNETSAGGTDGEPGKE